MLKMFETDKPNRSMLGVPALQCANALLGDDNNETMTGTVHAGPQLINVAVLIRKMCDSEDTKIQHTRSTAAVFHILIYTISHCTSSSRQAYPHHWEPDGKAEQDLESGVTSLATSQNHQLEHVGSSGNTNRSDVLFRIGLCALLITLWCGT